MRDWQSVGRSLFYYRPALPVTSEPSTLLIVIAEAYPLAGAGVVIAGRNPVLDELAEDTLRQRIGTTVELRQPSGVSTRVRVLDITLQRSCLLRGWSLFLLLPAAVDAEFVMVGVEVHGSAG